MVGVGRPADKLAWELWGITPHFRTGSTGPVFQSITLACDLDQCSAAEEAVEEGG